MRQLCQEYINALDTWYRGRWCFKNNRVYLLFPEVEIRNSCDERTVIHNLIVALRFNSDNDKVYSQRLHGITLNPTFQQYNAGYWHSHLPGKADTLRGSIDISKFKKFCLGSGEINNILLRLTNRVDPLQFELLLNQIRMYVAWESLEGVPHRHLSNISISSASSSQTNTSISNDIAKKVALEYIRRYPVNWSFNSINEKLLASPANGDNFIEQVRQLPVDLSSSMTTATTNQYEGAYFQFGDRRIEAGIIVESNTDISSLNISPQDIMAIYRHMGDIATDTLFTQEYKELCQRY